MNRNQVMRSLQTASENFIKSLPVSLHTYVRNSHIITGGSIASLFRDESVNDFDIYLTDSYNVRFLLEYYANLINQIYPHAAVILTDDKRSFNEASFNDAQNHAEYAQACLNSYFEKSPSAKHVPIYWSANAITLTGGLQLIFKFYGTPAEIHENFDFLHCTAYYEYHYSNPRLVISENVIESIFTKQLVYTGSKYIISSMLRLRKFLQRGWNISAGQLLKMMFDLKNIDFNDTETMRDQLRGVDVSYFYSLVNRIEKSDGSIDTDKLILAIDEMENMGEGWLQLEGRLL